jgi:hypothetical protein
MARIRSIHPGLYTDEAFMDLSMTGRVLLPALWIEAWDDGVIEWRPKRLKARIFPCDNIDLEELLGELVERNFIRVFEENGQKYAAIRNFRKWQSPQKPNSSNVLPADLESYVQLHYKSKAVLEQSNTGMRNSFQKGGREEGRKGRKEEGNKERAAIAAPKKPEQIASKGHRLPADWVPLAGDREYAADLGLNSDAVLEDFRGYWLAKTGQGATKLDWSLTWQGWCRREAQRSRPSSPQRAESAFGAFAPIETWTKPPINAVLGTRAGDAGHAIVGGFHIDWCAQELLAIAQLPDTPRSDWPVLAAWLRDGIEFHDTIAPVIRRIASRQAYEPPGSLKFFDKAVREARAA